MPSVDPAQFLVDNFPAPASYFGFFLCWIYPGLRIICRWWIFLFRFCFLLFQTFSFSIFLPIDYNIYWVKLFYPSYLFSSFLLCRLRFFGHVDFVFLILSVCLYHLAGFVNCRDLFFLINFVNCHDFFFACVELPIIQFSLVALSYQPIFNPSSRSYVIYELTISTTYPYSVHNCSYSNTLSPWSGSSYQKNPKWTWFPLVPFHPPLRSSNIYPDIWTDTNLNILHIKC